MSDPSLRTIPHTICPSIGDYRLWEVSDKTKITLSGFSFTLKADADGYFSTDADLLVRSPLLEATALRGLIGFSGWVTLPKDDEGNEVGLVSFRLNDGTNDYFWNGAAWVAAGAGDWNTAVEIHKNASAYDTTSLKLRVVANLSTTDKHYAPSFNRAVVMASFLLMGEVEDALERALLEQMANKIRPVVDIVVEWSGGDSFDFGALELEEPPGRTRSVVAAYNLTNDSSRITDLLQSYVAGVVTLTAAQDATDNIALVVEFEPIVAVTTHPDYDEIAGLPAIAIVSVEERFVGELPDQEFVYDPGDASAIVVDTPRVVNLRLGVSVRAARLLDYQRTTREFLRFVRENPVVRSQALGVDFDLVIESSPAMNPSPGIERILQGHAILRLGPVYRWLHQQRAGWAIKKINVGGDLNATIEK